MTGLTLLNIKVPVNVTNADEGRDDVFPFIPNLGTRLKQPLGTFSKTKINSKLCDTKFVMIYLFIYFRLSKGYIIFNSVQKEPNYFLLRLVFIYGHLLPTTSLKLDNESYPVTVTKVTPIPHNRDPQHCLLSE